MREFWLVDPEAHTIDQLVLRRGRYELVATTSERTTPRILRGVAIDLGELW